MLLCCCRRLVCFGCLLGSWLACGCYCWCLIRLLWVCGRLVYCWFVVFIWLRIEFVFGYVFGFAWSYCYVVILFIDCFAACGLLFVCGLSIVCLWLFIMVFDLQVMFVLNMACWFGMVYSIVCYSLALSCFSVGYYFVYCFVCVRIGVVLVFGLCLFGFICIDFVWLLLFGFYLLWVAVIYLGVLCFDLLLVVACFSWFYCLLWYFVSCCFCGGNLFDFVTFWVLDFVSS